MKKLILGAAFLSISTFAIAQQSPKIQKMDPAKMEQKRADHLKKMQVELNLSDAQVAQLKDLQNKKMAERKKMAPQKMAERKAKMELMKAKRAQHQAEMRKILTPEQYKKWEAKQQDMKKENHMMKKGHMQKAATK